MSAKGVGGGDSTGQQSPEERCRLGKRQRHVGGEPMECSYNRSSDTKRASSAHCEGALLCLPLQLQSNRATQQHVAMELARCLHEPKHNLLKETVAVLGVDRAIEIFRETAEKQRQGGMLSADGDKKRAPGGVFFSLVKKSVSEEEKKQIFARDKILAAKRTKRAKEARRYGRDNEKKAAHKHFGNRLGIKDGGERMEHPPDRNMERRGKGVWKDDDETVDYFDLDNPAANKNSDGELNEGWRNEFDDEQGDEFTLQVSMYKQLRREGTQECTADKTTERTEAGKGEEISVEDREAVEEFERTDDCEFGIDLSCNF